MSSLTEYRNFPFRPEFRESFIFPVIFHICCNFTQGTEFLMTVYNGHQHEAKCQTATTKPPSTLL